MHTHAKRRGFTLIEILLVIGIIAILAGVVLIAINPTRQFQEARDSQRVSNVNAILNAIGQYIADHKGDAPSAIASSTSPRHISNAGADICKDLVPIYLPSFPTDPSSSHKGTALTETDCTSPYDTNYSVGRDSNGRITISATAETPGAPVISSMR